MHGDAMAVWSLERNWIAMAWNYLAQQSHAKKSNGKAVPSPDAKRNGNELWGRAKSGNGEAVTSHDM